MAEYIHGPYVEEQETRLGTPVIATSALITIIDIFPAHLAKNPQPANDPILCQNIGEVANLVGDSQKLDKYFGCQGTNSAFKSFEAGPVVCINVLDRNNPEHRSQESNAAFLLRVIEGRAESAVAWAGTAEDKLTEDILLDTLALKNQQGTKTYQNGVDYTTARNSAGETLLTAILGGGIFREDAQSEEVTLRLSFTRLRPDKVTKWDVIGGYDVNTGEMTGLEAVNRINSKYGNPYVPGTIICPGWSTDPDVGAMMQAKAGNVNGGFLAMAAIDIDSTNEGAAFYQKAKAQREKQGVSSEFAVALWPKVRVGTRVCAYSAQYAAALAWLDAKNGNVPTQTPSNKDLKITGMALADGTDVLLDREQANLLNQQGIITARRRSAMVTWGSYTAAFPTKTDPKDKWTNIRRLFNWINNTLIMTFDEKVDSLLNKRAIEEAMETVDQWLSGLSAANQITQNCRAEYDPAANPVTNLYNGIAVVDIIIGAYPPLQCLIFRPRLDPSLLEAEMQSIGGGA